MGRVSDAKQRLMDAVTELVWTGSYGSTTIDDICEKAGVKKGSFYYFFESKAELAKTALSEEWERRRGELDSIFSPTVPPLERLGKYCDMMYRVQAEMAQKCGCVLGCPLFCVGSEVSTQEAQLRDQISHILDYKKKYLETAIRDAHAAGLVNAPDARTLANALFAYYQGLMTEARIRNDLEIMRQALPGTYSLLGVKYGKEIAAAAAS